MTGRIFVTGATGFIGRHVVEWLLRDGQRLTISVRDKKRCLETWGLSTRVAIIQSGSLAANKALVSAVSGADCIVHLAGLAHIAKSDGANSVHLFDNANTQATKALAEAAVVAGVPKFIHLSSLAAVTPNATDTTIDDTTVSEPETAYGRSKRAAERHVGALARNGTFAISLRPPLVVGADAKGNWASLQALAATGLPLPFASVANRRSFVSVDTVAAAITHLANGSWDAEFSGNYCLADEGFMSLPDVIRTLRSGMGIPARLVPCPPKFFELIGRMTGRRRQLAGLTGDLAVDASRFYKTFGFCAPRAIVEAISGSGRDYVAMRAEKERRA